VVIGNTKSYKK